MKRPSVRRYHFIYRTTCLVTGRFYIGMHSTDNVDDGYLGSGKILKRSIRKHGAENHKREILDHAESYDDLKELEKLFVTNDLLEHPLCMNIKLGGDGGFDFINSSRMILDHLKESKQSPEYRAKISEITRKKFEDEEYKERFYETVKSDEYRAKRSEQMKAIFDASPDYRKKISESKAGAKNPAYGKVWVNNGISSRLIDPVDLDAYQQDGWIRGLFDVALRVLGGDD